MYKYFKKYVFVFFLATLLAACSSKIKFNNVDISGSSSFSPAFELEDQTGKLRHLEDFKGKVLVVFFGYTQCPDVCPTTMFEMKKVMDLLGKDASKVQVAFITLDPERDTIELLEKYVGPLLPWHEACQLFLRLLRQSGEAKDVVAHNGSFQQAPSGKVYQLMRIAVEDDALFSEISANKYLLSVRFLKSERDKKAQLVSADVPFKLTLCQF